jgi:hypothetical protein
LCDKNKTNGMPVNYLFACSRNICVSVSKFVCL